METRWLNREMTLNALGFRVVTRRDAGLQVGVASAEDGMNLMEWRSLMGSGSK